MIVQSVPFCPVPVFVEILELATGHMIRRESFVTLHFELKTSGDTETGKWSSKISTVPYIIQNVYIYDFKNT